MSRLFFKPASLAFEEHRFRETRLTYVLKVSIENETVSVTASTTEAPPLVLMDELLERFSSASSFNDDEENFSDSTFDSSFDQDYELDIFNPYPNYNGLPGAYYGGYGQCHVCGDPNHWAGGCPARQGRANRGGRRN